MSLRSSIAPAVNCSGAPLDVLDEAEKHPLAVVRLAEETAIDPAREVRARGREPEPRLRPGFRFS